MMTLVSAVIRSTAYRVRSALSAAISASTSSRLERALLGITVPEFDCLPPFPAIEASLDGTADELLRADFFFCRCFLDLVDQLAWQPYVFRRHASIFHLSGENITRLTIVSLH